MINGSSRRTPLMAAGVLLGAGLGGFVDGIVFHQILQVHNMLSAQIPPNDLVGAKINMMWDGYFHAGVWLMTALGLYLLACRKQKRCFLVWNNIFGCAFYWLGIIQYD